MVNLTGKKTVWAPQNNCTFGLNEFQDPDVPWLNQIALHDISGTANMDCTPTPPPKKPTSTPPPLLTFPLKYKTQADLPFIHPRTLLQHAPPCHPHHGISFPPSPSQPQEEEGEVVTLTISVGELRAGEWNKNANQSNRFLWTMCA